MRFEQRIVIEGAGGGALEDLLVITAEGDGDFSVEVLVDKGKYAVEASEWTGLEAGIARLPVTGAAFEGTP